MNKINKSLLLLSLIAISSNAETTSLLEMSPKSYDKQVFGVDLSSFSSRTQFQGGDNIKKLGSDIEIGISNKATLKKFRMRKGEFYWRGRGSYDSKSAGSNFNIGFGLNYDYKLLYTNFELGYNYSQESAEFSNYVKKTSTDNNSSNVFNKVVTQIATNNTVDQPSIIKNKGSFITTGLGFKLSRKMEVGLLYSYESGNVKISEIGTKEKYRKRTFSFPVSYNVSKNIFVNINYRFEDYKIKEGEIMDSNKNKITVGVSWLYAN